MNIAIVDDEAPHASLLCKYAKKWAERCGADASADVYSSAGAFLFAWPEDRRYDALLLDIQMPGQSGMVLARRIRQTDEEMAIIFVTGYPDYMEEGYDVSALHYLLKPVREQKLFECLDRALKKTAAADACLLVQHGSETLRLSQGDIVWAEAFSREARITLPDRKLTVQNGIGELRAGLDRARFAYPHRCYIVGLKYIRRIGRDALTLDNGERVPVSRRRYDEVNRAFIGYHRGVRE